MEPIPPTRETLEKLVAQGDTMLPATLLRMSRRAKEIVPECVGLSLALINEGLTFTLAATSEVVAGLDAVQYVDGGPCVQGAHEDATIDVTPEEELLGEYRWLLYAQASAAAGVRSNLTMPILGTDGHVIGTVNLYAATPGAFVGHHDELAEALHASAAEAVTNADLSFSTRLAAVEAPQRLEEQYEVNITLGIIAEGQGVDIATARKLSDKPPPAPTSAKARPPEPSEDSLNASGRPWRATRVSQLPVLLRMGIDNADQVIRIYRPEPTAAFSRRDSRRPGFSDARSGCPRSRWWRAQSRTDRPNSAADRVRTASVETPALLPRFQTEPVGNSAGRRCSTNGSRSAYRSWKAPRSLRTSAPRRGMASAPGGVAPVAPPRLGHGPGGVTPRRAAWSSGSGRRGTPCRCARLGRCCVYPVRVDMRPVNTSRNSVTG